MRTLPILLGSTLLLGLCSGDLRAQASKQILEEAKVPPYTTLDPLIDSRGAKITTPEQWKVRRQELFALFETHVYGKTPKPTRPLVPRFEILSENSHALGDIATRRQIRIHFTDKPDGPHMDLLVYLPRGAGPQHRAPAFLGLNFRGNHGVSLDPGIALSTQWFRNDLTDGVVNNKATEQARGKESSRWPVERIIGRGYALATAYYGDLDPDFDDGFKNGIQPLFYKPGQTQPAPDEWGAIGAWAWGLSRALDYLETAPEIDATKTAVMGHSRLGKTALWAGAQDSRFAIVISNNSGCGGAALSRRVFGETVEQINRNFPHWFCDNFTKFNEHEELLPVDQNELIALIAPRPVLVSSAEDDRGADPRGEFLATLAADPVYRLLGTDGLAISTMPRPAPENLIHSTLGYRYRPGRHGVVNEDWDAYMNFADRHFSRR